MLSLSLLATETVFPLVSLGLKDLVLFFAEGHCLDAVRKQTPKTTSLSSSAVFLLCVESSFWYLQLPGITDDMQLLSVVSHSCVLAHQRTCKGGSPALSTTTLHGSMEVGSECERKAKLSGMGTHRTGWGGGSSGEASYEAARRAAEHCL